MARPLRDGLSTVRVSHVVSFWDWGEAVCVPPSLPGVQSGDSSLSPQRLCSVLCHAEHLPHGGTVAIIVLFLEASPLVFPASI